MSHHNNVARHVSQDVRAQAERDRQRIEKEFNARLERNAQAEYQRGYDDGAAAAHPLVTWAIGALCGALGLLAWQKFGAAVAAFFS